MAKGTELMVKQGFVLPTVCENMDFSPEELAEDGAGVELSFPRVKVPSGGGLAFEVFNPNDPENPDVVKTIEGVLLYHHASNAYWPGGADEENKIPACSSPDGIYGVGYPGIVCATCELNQWDSGEGGKGKACKNSHQLYILQSGQFVPLNITLPPTSIRPFVDFLRDTFKMQRRASWASIVQIGLKKAENNAGQVYSLCSFRCVEHLSGEMLATARALREGFKAQIVAEQQAKIKAGMAQGEDAIDISTCEEVSENTAV